MSAPTATPPLEQIESLDAEAALLARHLESARPDGGVLRVLEAGCGQRWPLTVERLHLVGLDLDPDALALRMEQVGDLDEGVVGDLVTAELPEASFDAIYCAFVLEHVEQADRVLENFASWVRPGGLVVVKVPDPHAVRGAVTRLTPHWVHVAYYRYVARFPHAGEPGYQPYPTYYHPVVSRGGIRDFAASHGFDLVAEHGDSRYFSDGPGIVGTSIAAGVRVAGRLSRGRLAATHDNLLFILRRR